MIPKPPKATVLVVDDDGNLLSGLQRSLGKKFHILTEESAEKGLLAIRKSGPIHVVVSDLKMPGMDGIDFLFEVRKISPDTVRILLTGCDADATLAIEGVNRGQIFRYLTKPCSSELLKQEIDAAYQLYLERAWEKARAEATEAANAANRAKSRFLAAMSHEIRTPMNAIVGLSSLLLEEEPDKDKEESLRIIRESAEGLLGLINDILDFSKIEAGALSLEQIPYGLRDLVSSACKMLQIKMEQKGLAFHVEIEDDVPDALIGDPTRLRQILVNLLGNALKFTERGSVALLVGRRSGATGESSLRFEVKDTGIGMSEETRSRLFVAYAQGDPSIARRFGGTGLGLSISKRLAEAMGGGLEVQSAEGEGSSFILNLPIILDRRSRAVGEIAPGHRSIAPKRISQCAHRILVAEDNLINQLVAVKILEKLGYEADAVSNGKEAVDAVLRNSYDLVLMDVEMPIMNGIEATRAVRSAGSKIKIIGFTAHADGSLHEKLSAEGMNDSLVKPVRPEVLRQAIWDQLS